MEDNKQPVEGERELSQEERDAASAAKYRAQLRGEAENMANVDSGKKPEDGGDKPQRPAHIPEKFWDAEKGEVNVDALAKSYSELEKRGSKPPKDGAETKPGENAEGEQPNADSYEVGVKNFGSLREQATEKLLAGEALSDELYAGFEKHGLSREDIDDWVAGQEARGTLARMEVFNEIGGEETYKAMIEWAKANFTADEIAVYDRDIASFDKAVRMTAVRGLNARYTQASGTKGRNVTNSGAKKGNAGYESGAQMRADMRDPRYAKDPAFREEVARKVAAARAAGVELRV